MKQQLLQAMIIPAIEAVGFELYGLEYLPQGKYSLLRVYIEKPDGVNLDDCELASRQISAILDVENPISGEYNLEVSSPGIERPLFTVKHYQRAIGKPVKVNMLTPINGQRNFVGVIKSVDDEQIVLTVAEQEQILLLNDVVKAHLIYQP